MPEREQATMEDLEFFMNAFLGPYKGGMWSQE